MTILELTRARIKALFDSEIISPKTTRWSNKIDNVKAKIDNVKAKIDNVKAKIQDKEEKEPWSRPTLARRPVFGQLATSPTSFPPEESLCLARQVSARLVCGPRRMVRASPPTRAEKRISTTCKCNSWRPCRRPAPPRALMLVWPAARPSHRHHLSLCHTRVQPEALKHPLRRAQG
jgi:hypothetical protein